MNRLYQKIPFLMELFINGFFIFLYSFSQTNKIHTPFISLTTLDSLLKVFGYIAPIVVLINIISSYVRSGGMEDFFRKYVFSLVIFIPMLMTIGDLEFTFWLAAVHLFSSVLSLYEANKPEDGQSVLKNKGQSLGIIEKIRLKPAQIILISFAGIILIGTLLLSLPISAAEGKDISFIDALFMATSATCVTGLSTISLHDNFSIIGQLVILALIQIGGLGYMTLYSSMTILLGKALAVKEQVLMQDVLDINSFEDLLGMIMDIIRITIVIEFWGAILLSIGFLFEGLEFGESIYYGFFHAISAFCNAGFALFNNSLEDFPSSPLISGTVSILITMGGLGFIVLKELGTFVTKRKRAVNLSVHTKVVLTTSAILILIPAFYIFFSEFLHGIDKYDLWTKIQVSLFQSITLRTAGFNTVPLGELYSHTLYLFILVMFIGASPGSTGGGIKTTTFAILFQSVRATVKGSEEVTFFERKIPATVVVRSIAIIVISMILVSSFLLLLMQLEPDQSFMALFFEAVSAFATVGLSLGVTPFLSFAGKLSIVALMFVGRVGPLTLVLAIGQRKESSGQLEYPEGRVMIG